MAKSTTFKVSNQARKAQGLDPVEVTFMAPESVSDERWGELGFTEKDVNDKAVSAVIVQIQSGARDHLEEGDEAVQNYVTGWNSKTAGAKPVRIPKDQAKKLKFTEEQLAALRAQGVTVGG